MPRITKPKAQIDLQRVEVLAGRGLSIEQIAAALGISDRTIYRHKKYGEEKSELSQAIKRGRAKSIGYVAGKLQQLIEDGNLGAIIFYLKAQGGWKEVDRRELTGADGTPLQTAKVVLKIPDNGRDKKPNLEHRRI